ncbi:unnamed protein product [Orchesella dallaii]|uniref:Graves disease carrier protein n=1 Tax=Orchesella dallaii TaxID=48710 RepID=A0ABP1QFZ2_9HEXA
MPNPNTQHVSYIHVRGNDDSLTSLSAAPAEPTISQDSPVVKQATESASSPSQSLHSTKGFVARRSGSSSSLPKVFPVNKVFADASPHTFITSLAFTTGTNTNTNPHVAAAEEEFCSATLGNVNVSSASVEKEGLQHLRFASVNAEKSINVQGNSTKDPFESTQRISFSYFLASLGSISAATEFRFLHDQRKSAGKSSNQDLLATSFESTSDGKHLLFQSDYEKEVKSRIIESDGLLLGWFKEFKNFIVTFKTEAIVFADGNEKQGTSSLNITTSASSSREKDRREQSTTPASIRVSPASEVTEDVPVSPENLKMKEERQLEFILKSLVAGGVAGMCAKTSVAPLDRMKILLQAHSKHYSHLGVFSGLQGIVKKERFIALYKGNGAQMVRIFPYAATQFTSFEMYKKLLGGEESHIGRFAAGSAAGVTAVALTYPLDTIRARLAFQVTGEHVYNGIYSCAAHIFREEGGIRALYRGFIPTVCGMIPYAGLSFYCFESFKYICMKYFPTYTCKSHSTNSGGLVLLLYAKLLCGGVAGAVAQTVAYPLDVTRRRMQLAMMDEKTKKFGLANPLYYNYTTLSNQSKVFFKFCPLKYSLPTSKSVSLYSNVHL